MTSVEPIGPFIRRLRTARGWSLSHAADLLCAGYARQTVTKSEWSRWERGKRTPTEWLPDLAALFEIPITHLEAAVTAATALKRSGSGRPPVELIPDDDCLEVRSVGSGRRIGRSAADNLSARAHGLRLADDLLAGGDLIHPAVRELNGAVRLVRESTYSDELRPALLSAVGELAQIAGWIVSDAGHSAQAAQIYRLGISAAREAQDAVLAANIIGSLAYQTANTGDPATAVHLATAAYEEAGEQAPPRARALSWDRIGWAHAKNHDPQQTSRALGRAGEALTEQCEEDDPPYLYWVDAGELQVMEARAYTELHRPLRAVPILTEVLHRYEITHTRELALYLSWLVIALADANEPEEAATVADRMLDLTTDLPSRRTIDRSAIVLTRLDEFRQIPSVSTVLDTHADLLNRT